MIPPFPPRSCQLRREHRWSASLHLSYTDSERMLLRAIVLRQWIEMPLEEASVFLDEHVTILRDPLTIALLILWQRKEDDLERCTKLGVYRNWLIPYLWE